MQSREQADLLVTLPVACFAQVTGRGSPAVRAEALRLIRAGLPREAIGQALEIPRWMCRLPPEAFVWPLPETLRDSEQERLYGRCIANFIPANAQRVGPWLRGVLYAKAHCDDQFSLWLASSDFVRSNGLAFKYLPCLTAYAWYSRHNEHPAAEQIARPWTPQMSFRRAMASTYDFMLRLLVDFCGDHHARSGIWSRARDVDGFLIEPLLTFRDFEHAETVMKNCITRYVGRTAHGLSQLYSISYEGEYLANMEVRPKQLFADSWHITELRGHRNARPTARVVEVAVDWLALQNLAWKSENVGSVYLPLKEDQWDLLWQPWWAEKGESGVISRDADDREIYRQLKKYREYFEPSLSR